MHHYKIELSGNTTNRFVLRYSCGVSEGIAVFKITPQTKRNINRAYQLAIIGSAHIQGLSVISLNLMNEKDVIFLNPESDISSIVLDDDVFVEEFYNWKRDFWYLKSISRRRYKDEIPMENVHIELRSLGVSLHGHSYLESKHITGSIFTTIIPYAKIGI
jgi:hypothetical protein